MTLLSGKSARWTLLLVGVTLLLPQAALAEKKVLRLKLDGPVLEAPDEGAELMALLGGTQSETLRGLVGKIEKASKDPDVVGIAMIIEQPQLGFAQLQELSQALREFRASGKKIFCFMDHAGNGSYALATVADHIMLQEYSELGIIGLHAELSFYKGMLDKMGVYADMLHCGAYKSALEPFTRTEPSPEAAENVNWLLDGIYDAWISMMSEGRKLSPDTVKALVDRAPLSAEAALEAKLVDQIGSFHEFKQLVRKEFGQDVEIVKRLDDKDGLEIDFNNPVAIFLVLGELMNPQEEERKPGIGLIYIDGAITMGKSETSPFGGGGNAGSTTIRAAFEQACEDDNVKALVVRVDSPGGSALASDIMWKAATRCAKEKLLIVSMGNVAGSGGYYVAIPGDQIFADEATITASIGVVGGKLVWKELWEDKLGVTTTAFDRGEHAGLWTMNQSWTEDERAWVQKYMTDVYDQFKGRIMASRGDRLKKELESIAGGRVFTGKQALELGLIDQLGGLKDAIEYTAKRAGLDDYEVYVYPEQKNPFEEMFASLTGQEPDDEWEFSLGRQAGSDALLTPHPLLRAAAPLLQGLAPQQMGALGRAFERLITIETEHVGCFMPFELNIR